jgi:hypothetical protein
LASDNATDLKIARALFEIGDAQVSEIKVFTGRLETVLFSDQFERMSAASSVADASIPIIDAINGICFIHDPVRSPLRSSGVHSRLPGDWYAEQSKAEEFRKNEEERARIAASRRAA